MPNYIVGERPHLNLLVTDPATKADVDPGSVVLRVKSPSGVVSVYAYPAQIAKLATGLYQYDLTLTEKGRWFWRWETDTPYQGVSQGDLVVAPSNI